MVRIVADASVGAKWFFDEDLKEEAYFLIERLKQKKILIIVPEIFYPEIASACRKRVRRGLLRAEDALKTFDQLMDLPLERYSDHELSDVALENSLQYGVSSYDGLYLALAEVYVAPLVTADKELFNRCQNRFDFIEFLGDF